MIRERAREETKVSNEKKHEDNIAAGRSRGQYGQNERGEKI